MREELANMRRTVERMAAAATPGAWSAAAAAPPPNDDQRPMTYDEKRTLSMNINKLPSDKLNKVLQIIAESRPLGDQKDEEIEIDIGALDTKTLRELQRYVKGCVTKKKPRSKKHQPRQQLQAARDQQAEVARRIARIRASRRVVRAAARDMGRRRSRERGRCCCRRDVVDAASELVVAIPRPAWLGHQRSHCRKGCCRVG